MSGLSPDESARPGSRWPDWLPDANTPSEHEARLRHVPWDDSDLDRNDPDPEVQAFIAHVDRTTRISNPLTFESQMSNMISVAGHRSSWQVGVIRLVGALVLLGFTIALMSRLF